MKLGVIASGVLAGMLAGGAARAFYLDEDRALQVTGKIFTQGSWRTEDSDSGGRACLAGLQNNCSGWTFPDTRAGQLIQHRNLLDAEFYHDVGKWIGPEFRVLDQFGYRLRAKWYYDGLYDYGPHQFRNGGEVVAMATGFPNPSGVGVTDGVGLIENRRQNSTGKNALWNAYVDIGRSNMKFRIGRQDLSWGESDGFRLLDQITPLDNRFGFPLVEDLDDRRIPLWMVRPTWRIGTMGPFSNLLLDGYWVPGTIDNEVSPVAPPGNPFGLGSPPGKAVVIKPGKTLDNSRGGARLVGTVGGVTFSVGNYVTFNDYPSARVRVNSIGFVPVPGWGTLLNPNADFLVEFYPVQITGASATFALPFDPYAIIRAEAAHAWDERVFVESEALTKAVVTALTTGKPAVGGFATRNVMRWMIGADRNLWLRWLNPENTFLLSAQYFHTNILQYDDDIANAAVSSTDFVEAMPGVKAGAFHFVPRRNDEMLFTYMVNTLVWHGAIQPQVFGMYDTRGVHAVSPSLSYQWGSNVQLTLKYAVIVGTYANLGFFRDRDELVFRVQYNLS